MKPQPQAYEWARANSFNLLQVVDAAGKQEGLQQRAAALRQAYLDALPDRVRGFVKDSSSLMGESDLAYFPLLARDSEVCILLEDKDVKNAMRAAGQPGEEFGNVFVTVDWSRRPDEMPATERATYYPLFSSKHLAQFPVLHAMSVARGSVHSVSSIMRQVLPEG
ncbi:hypothetical protein, partial [Paraburkholderia sp. RL17-373-BIF-A]|uniref:hypothetical protein n=1 Tax=Paraburkholderia sp. RL17-373-BIF-A TaxID=3031629 RepID=UPI0038BC7F1D